MAINSLASMQSCLKLKLNYFKNNQTTTLSNLWQSLFALGAASDFPVNSVWSAGNTANGIVPDGSTAAGYPAISASSFGAGKNGYLTKVEALSNFNFGGMTSGTARMVGYDRVFVAGDYSFNASTSLTSQPAYSSRLPFKSDGTTVDYGGLEIWAETVSNFTGTQAFTVTYTDQSGNTGHTTGAVNAPTSNLSVGGCWPLQLASGDSGIQKIESVTGSGGSAGTANIMVLRPLWDIVIPGIPSQLSSLDFAQIGAPQIFYNTALFPLLKQTLSSTGSNGITFEISVG